jgi:Gnt-I system high-affinity gluconate transporter/Gnt-II system L-idonate transporter
MPLLWVTVGIALLLALVLVVRLDAFLALLLTAFAVGVLNGMAPLAVLDSVLRGVGSTMGGVVLVLVFGAMLGTLLDESGAAQVIVARLAGAFGPRRLPLAMSAAGLLVGLPMLYNAGFLVLIPLVYAMSVGTGLPLAYLGVPMAAALSVTHGFLPPHPAPTFLAFAYGAGVGRTLLVGLAAAVPACLLGGLAFGRTLRTGAVSRAVPPPGLYRPRDADPGTLPGLGASVGTALVPVVCMLVGAVVDVAAGTAGLDPIGGAATFAARLAAAVPDPGARAAVAAAKFVGNANVALLAGVLAALYALGVRRGRRMDDLMAGLGRGVAGVAGLVLVIAAGGAFAQVLRDGGVADYVARRAAALRWDPLVLAFAVAAALRFAVGSATVAALTTAGILAPVAHAGGARPELLVVATGAGSLMFSHVNDTGFWMFKQYFNLTVRQTFATWSVMEAIVALAGLGAVLVMDAVL